MHSENIRTSALVILCTIAVVFVMVVLKPLLIPFLIAVMISYLFSPIIEMMAGWKIPRTMTVLIIFIISFGLLGVFARLLATNISGFTSQIPLYQTQLSTMLETSSHSYPWIKTSIGDVTNFLLSLPLGNYANVAINSSLNFLSDTFLVVLFVAYICISGNSYSNKIRRAFSGNHGKKIQSILSRIHKGISKYLIIQTFVNLGFGVSTGIIAWSFGLPFAVLWGFLAFVLNYIPIIGAVVAVLPMIITAAVELGFAPAAWVLLLVVISQIFWASVISPKFTGDSLGLSAVVILLALVFWAWLWGIVGAILAVPMTYMVKIVCENITSLKPIAVFMDDK